MINTPGEPKPDSPRLRFGFWDIIRKKIPLSLSRKPVFFNSSVKSVVDLKS
jgi:hypothetical protein